MPTDFNQNNFVSGDLIKSEHIKRTFSPINKLETGEAWYRLDTGSANAAVVDFSDPDENGLDASALTDGQLIHFKAAGTNTGAATLTLNGLTINGVPTTITRAITKSGSTALSSGDIQAGQMVVVIYNSSSGGRFEMANGGPSSQGSTGISFGKRSREFLVQTQYINGTNQYLTWLLQDTAGTAVSTWTNGLKANVNGVYLLQWSAAGGCDYSPSGQFSIYPTVNGGWHQSGAGWYYNDGNANDFSMASGTSFILNSGDEVGLYVATSGVRFTVQRSNMTLTYLGPLAT